MSTRLNAELVGWALKTSNKPYRRRHSDRKRVVNKMIYNQAVRQRDTEAALEIDAWARRAMSANGFGDF